MSTTPANIFSEQLDSLTNTFSSLISEMVPTSVSNKLYPNDQTYSSNMSNFNASLYTCDTSITALDSNVSDNITIMNQVLNNILSNIDSSSRYSKLIPNLFDRKNTSYDMKIDNMSLYNYQILLNWEMFIGMFFIFLCLIFYYRKYYNTKEVIQYTTQKIMDIKEDVTNNVKTAKEEITKMSEPPIPNK